jgi:pilus assembly protein Flp/PilA
MIRSIRTHLSHDEGASAVEYGLLVAAIAAVVAVILFALGGTIRDSFSDTNDCIASDAGADC